MADSSAEGLEGIGFSAQAAADVEDEVLFTTRGDFRASLENIADHIARPAVTGQSSRPMTFALYGPWGAGKSSALNFLEALVEEKVSKAQRRPMYTSTHYPAPLWENLHDARTTLAYEIVRGLAVRAPALISRYLAEVAQVEQQPAMVLPPDLDLKEAIEFQRILQTYADAPPLLEQWMRDRADSVVESHLGEEVTQGDAHATTSRRVHVVFVDDLDRCGRDFTAALLAAINQWSAGNQHNLFFVLAVSREHLVESVREHLLLGPRYPHQALEKYVHLGVELPTLLTTPGEVASYLCALADRLSLGDAVQQKHIAQLRALLTESAETYPDGVLAPLLRVDQQLTPRSAKHRFNTFIAQFKPATRASLEPADVKKWVLRALWPDFWWSYLWNVEVQKPSPEWRDRLRRIDQLGELGDSVRGLWELSDEQIRPILKALADRRGIDLGDIEPSLIAYLRAMPAYTPPRLLLSDTIPTDRDIESKANRVGTPDNQAYLLFVQADRAEDEHQRDELLGYLRELVDLTSNPELTVRAAVSLGNSALIAERQGGADLALQLHTAAHRLDPTHWNILQNYIDFILEQEIASRYGEVEEGLTSLQAEGSSHRPERTRALALRFAHLTGKAVAGGEAKVPVQEMLESIRERPSVALLRDMSATFEQLGRRDAIREASRFVAQAVTVDADRYASLRVYTDFLPAEDAAEEADIYMFMLNSGLACLPGHGDALTAVKHNLAIALSRLGYNNMAALLWAEAYGSEAGSDDVLRRVFAIHLRDLGRPGDAEAVLLGQRLEPLGIDAERLPERFAPGVDAWWQGLKPSTANPCVSDALGIGNKG